MNIVERVKNILVTPKTEWPVIAGETAEPMQILTGYVLPLAAIPAVGQIIGGGMGALGFSYGIATGLVAFLVAIVGVYIAAYVIDLLAPNFGSEKDLGRSMQLVAYSSTPGWVAGILYIVPTLAVVVLIANLYGLYLMYLGLPAVKKTQQDKQVVYLIVSIIAIIVVYAILGMLLGAVVFGILGVSALTGAMM